MYCLVFFSVHTLYFLMHEETVLSPQFDDSHQKYVTICAWQACRGPLLFFYLTVVLFLHFHFEAFIFDSSTTVQSQVKWWFLVTFCSSLLRRVESTRKKNQHEPRQHDTITYRFKWHGSKYFFWDNSSLFSQCGTLAKLKWTQNWNADCYNGVKLLHLWKAGRNKLSANDCQSFQSI